MDDRVVITGTGIICALGVPGAEVCRRCCGEGSGIRPSKALTPAASPVASGPGAIVLPRLATMFTPLFSNPDTQFIMMCNLRATPFPDPD